MKISSRFYSKSQRAGSAIEGIIWLVLGVGALGFVGLQVAEVKKNELPPPVEIMKVETDPAKLIPLIQKFLKEEAPDVQFVEIGDFGTLREFRYVGAKVKAGKNGDLENWVFSGPDDTITFGESTELILRRLQQDAKRNPVPGRIGTELSQLRKMAKM